MCLKRSFSEFLIVVSVTAASNTYMCVSVHVHQQKSAYWLVAFQEKLCCTSVHLKATDEGRPLPIPGTLVMPDDPQLTAKPTVQFSLWRFDCTQTYLSCSIHRRLCVHHSAHVGSSIWQLLLSLLSLSKQLLSLSGVVLPSLPCSLLPTGTLWDSSSQVCMVIPVIHCMFGLNSFLAIDNFRISKGRLLYQRTSM